MERTRVKWTVQPDMSYMETIMGWYPEVDTRDFDKHYEGDVIGTNTTLLGYTYLIVACTDNKIREVEISKAKVVSNEKV